MKCEKYLILIDDLVENELDEPTSRQVTSHLFNCQTCGAHYETLKSEKELFAHYLFDAEPPNDLWEKFQTKLENETIKVSPSAKIFVGFNGWKENFAGFWRFSPALACAALILLFGIGFVFFNQKPNENVSQNDYLAENQPLANQIEKRETENPPANPTDNKKDVSQKNKNSENKFSKAKSKTETGVKTTAVKVTKIKKKVSSAIPEVNSAEVAQLSEDPQLKQIRNLENEAAKQVEKVELLLRSFRNARSDEGDETFDLAYEKEQARKLLAKNVQLRRSAETYGSLYTEEILSRVEPYLLDIANLDSKSSADKVRDIKERVSNQNIIASLQIY